VSGKEALKANIIKTLTDTLFNTAKVAYADELKSETANMSTADAKAFEFNKDNAMKMKAKQDAEKQAEIEVAGQSGQQLEERLKQQEKAKMEQDLEKEVTVEVKKKVDALTKKALNRVYEDDLQAMEAGHAHVSEMTEPEQEHDANVPNIAKAALDPAVMQLAAGATAGQDGLSNVEGDGVPYNGTVNITGARYF